MMSGRMNAAGDEAFTFGGMQTGGPYVGFEHGAAAVAAAAAAAQRAGMQQQHHHHHHMYDSMDFAAAMQFGGQEAPQLLALPPSMAPMAPPTMPLPLPLQMPVPMPGDVYPALGIVKREGGGVPGQDTAAAAAAGRIGLNLGRRTYFSPGDMLAVDRLLMRSRLGGVFGLGFGGAHHQPPRCQAEGCKADLSGAKHYHRRHKVCEYHAKASVVAASGKQQRFCQQCSRFHVLTEFDEAKRSCRKRLAEHNRRRRKPATTNVAAAKDAAASPVVAGKKPSGATTSYTGDSKNMVSMSAAKSPISSNTSVISCLAEQGKQAAARPTVLTLGGAPPPPPHDSSTQLGAVLHAQHHHHHHHHQQEHMQVSSLVHINGAGSGGGGGGSNNILSCSSVCSSALPSTATNGEVSDQNNDNSHNNGSNNNNMHLFEVDFM